MQVEHMVYGHVSVAPLDESVRRLVEERPKDGVQESAKDFLGDPVFDHWNAEWAELGLLSVFGDIHPAQRQRLKAAAFEFSHKGSEIFEQVGLEHLDADLVDTGSASVAFHRLEGSVHEVLIDPTYQ